MRLTHWTVFRKALARLIFFAVNSVCWLFGKVLNVVWITQYAAMSIGNLYRHDAITVVMNYMMMRWYCWQRCHVHSCHFHNIFIHIDKAFDIFPNAETRSIIHCDFAITQPRHFFMLYVAPITWSICLSVLSNIITQGEYWKFCGIKSKPHQRVSYWRLLSLNIYSRSWYKNIHNGNCVELNLKKWQYDFCIEPTWKGVWRSLFVEKSTTLIWKSILCVCISACCRMLVCVRACLFPCIWVCTYSHSSVCACAYNHSHTLTHWGRDKMEAISQTTFSGAFPWIKIYEFRLILHWSLFLRFELTIFQHWFR